MFNTPGLIRTICAAAVLGFAALPASAATVSQSAQPVVDIATPLASSTTGSVFQGVQGSVNGVRRDVWEGSALANTGFYTSVSAGASATYSFGGPFSILRLIWGSPDDYNKIEFYLGGVSGTLIDTVSTVAILGPVLPCCVTGQTNIANSLVTITNFAGGPVFDTVVFSSGQNAFEFDGVTAAVPLPAGGLLLLGALGGLAALRRRKMAA